MQRRFGLFRVRETRRISSFLPLPSGLRISIPSQPVSGLILAQWLLRHFQQLTGLTCLVRITLEGLVVLFVPSAATPSLQGVQKKRKYGRDQGDDRDGADKQPDEDELLRDATTLYVGNLCVHRPSCTAELMVRSGHSTQPRNRSTSSSQSAHQSAFRRSIADNT